jgi:Yip1 domain
MPDTASSFATPQSIPPKSFLSRLVGVFIEPGETFGDIARKPDWIAPLVLMLLVTVATLAVMMVKIGAARILLHSLQQSGRAGQMDPAQLDQAVQRGAGIVGVVIPLTGVIMFLIVLLAVAGFGLLVLNVFFGQRAKFKDVFSVTCYSYIPHIVGAAMAIAVMFFGDPAAFSPESPAPSSPGFFMDPLIASRATYAIASSLDIFTFWFMILLAMGLSRVSEKVVKTGTIFMTCLGGWVLLVLVRVGLALVFSSR